MTVTSFLRKPRADRNPCTERQKRPLTKRVSSQRRKTVSRSRSRALSLTTLWPIRNRIIETRATVAAYSTRAVRSSLILGELRINKSKMCECAHLAFLCRHANAVLNANGDCGKQTIHEITLRTRNSLVLFV